MNIPNNQIVFDLNYYHPVIGYRLLMICCWLQNLIARDIYPRSVGKYSVLQMTKEIQKIVTIQQCL